MMALDPINVNVKEKTSQELKKIVLSGRALNVFVIVIVFVFVFVFVLLKKCERVAVKGCIDQFHAIRLRKCQSTNRKYDIEKYSW